MNPSLGYHLAVSSGVRHTYSASAQNDVGLAAPQLVRIVSSGAPPSSAKYVAVGRWVLNYWLVSQSSVLLSRRVVARQTRVTSGPVFPVTSVK